MKKLILSMCILLVLFTVTGCGCAKREEKAKIVTNVEISIVNDNGDNFTGTLNISDKDKYVSMNIKNNSASLNINDDVFKKLDIFESTKKVIKLAVDKDIIDSNTDISINVKAPSERTEELYRYIYKYALDPLIDEKIDVEIDYKFNE